MILALPIINPGDQGKWVLTWQKVVNASGGGMTEDGQYGSQSQTVCKFIQGANHLPQTGIVDLATWAISFPQG